ncbi:MAG: peptidoglycan DD-metalloendopeptidase family protein [Clostridia bacterium]|nr:peptidoglycan DD-metalloendopeptidase family protein [Clostridia bacterium]
MKSVRKLAVRAFAVILCTAVLCGVPAGAALTDATVKSYEQQLAELQAKQEEALANLEAVRGDYSDIMTAKASYDEMVALYNKKKDLTMQQLDAVEKQIAEKQAAIAAAEEAIAKQETAFTDRMITLYEEGEASFLEMILGAASLKEFLSRLDMVMTIQAYDKQVISSLEENKASLAKNLEELEYSLELRREAQATLEADIQAAQQMADESLAYMQELQNNEKALLQQYYANKEAEKALNDELTAYLAELQKKQQKEYVGGSLGWPLPLDVQYVVSSEYGWRDLWGQPDEHYGIDFACACNTPVYAANAGTVVTSAVHWSYGEYIVIDHGGGQATLYAHMNSGTRKVFVGDTVEKGQLIGLVGTTGTSSNYHLHFEVRINGKHTQPRDYITLP